MKRSSFYLSQSYIWNFKRFSLQNLNIDQEKIVSGYFQLHFLLTEPLPLYECLEESNLFAACTKYVLKRCSLKKSILKRNSDKIINSEKIIAVIHSKVIHRWKKFCSAFYILV